jgi:hypothetical protein
VGIPYGGHCEWGTGTWCMRIPMLCWEAFGSTFRDVGGWVIGCVVDHMTILSFDFLCYFVFHLFLSFFLSLCFVSIFALFALWVDCGFN